MYLNWDMAESRYTLNDRILLPTYKLYCTDARPPDILGGLLLFLFNTYLRALTRLRATALIRDKWIWRTEGSKRELLRLRSHLEPM